MNTISSNGEIGRHAHFQATTAPDDRISSRVTAVPIVRVDESPVLHAPGRRVRETVDQLAVHAARLARQNEALDDFAGLVAHEVKSALLHALLSDEPEAGLMRALELVDNILEAVRANHANGDVVAVDLVVQETLSELGMVNATVSASAAGTLPLSPAALRLVLRNLLANALAAGAHNIHIFSLAGGERQVLVVDDDGVGLDSRDGYVTGDQIGLALCRRLLARFGGAIELKPRSTGTRAVISVSGADR